MNFKELLVADGLHHSINPWITILIMIFIWFIIEKIIKKFNKNYLHKTEVKKMKIELDKTDIRFLNMVLRDIQYAPNIREGLGFRPFAYYLQKKINKEECINPIKEYEKERYNHINNIVKQKKYLFEYKDPDFETLKKVIRKRLTDLKNK